MADGLAVNALKTRPGNPGRTAVDSVLELGRSDRCGALLAHKQLDPRSRAAHQLSNILAECMITFAFRG
jgi:hypothetical protein